MPRKTAALTIEPRFRINGRRLAFGPGKADLLEQIAHTGSIAEAAKTMGMSYMRAWTLVRSLEQGFREPLVRKLRGGHSHGGAELTATGRKALQLYRELETRTAPTVRHLARRFAALQGK